MPRAMTLCRRRAVFGAEFGGWQGARPREHGYGGPAEQEQGGSWLLEQAEDSASKPAILKERRAAPISTSASAAGSSSEEVTKEDGESNGARRRVQRAHWLRTLIVWLGTIPVVAVLISIAYHSNVSYEVVEPRLVQRVRPDVGAARVRRPSRSSRMISSAHHSHAAGHDPMRDGGPGRNLVGRSGVPRGRHQLRPRLARQAHRVP